MHLAVLPAVQAVAVVCLHVLELIFEQQMNLLL